MLKFVLAISLVGLAFVATYSSAPTEFLGTELRDILILGAAVNTSLLGAALVLLRAKAQNAALSLIVLASVASAYLVHTDLYLVSGRVLLALSVLAMGAGLFVVFGLIDGDHWLRGGVPAVALLALVVAAVPHLGSWVPEADRDAQDRAWEDRLNPLSFESTPNLYFVSFDGLGPQSVGQEYLDIETTELVDLVNAEFRRFPNLFSESMWSLHSLNVLASLDHEIYQSALLREGPVGHLTGEYPTALFDILAANGYQTNFVYPYSNFGSIKGPYVDNLVVGQGRPLCARLDPSITALAFWGYCNLPLDDKARWYDGIFEDQLDHILPIADRQGPQFLLTYFRLPQHTHRGFDNSDPGQREKFRARYIDHSEKAALILAQLLKTLDERDPKAMLFVFGDHGPRLSYNVEFEEDSEEFYIKDNYAVLGGIYPRDACEPWFDETLSEQYMTNLDAVHTILRCLTGGQEALIGPRERSIPRSGNYFGIPDDGVERSFSDFLYE